jgi:hypothetical protein
MNQFTVPQFIDVEDKIFGPITTRQFIILLVAGLLLFVIYKLADTALFVFFLAIIGGLALILAFVKINGQAFHYFLLNIFQTLRRPSLRVWNKSYSVAELNDLRKMAPVVENVVQATAQQIPAMRIRNLSLMVNTGGYYNGEN